MEKIYIDDTEVDENNNIIIVDDNDQHLPIDTFDDSLLSICNIEHISICNCQRAFVESKYRYYFNEEMNELIKNKQEENKNLIEVRKDYAMEKALKDVSRHCIENNIRCSIERNKLKNHLHYFNEKYDLSDPRVFVIIEALMNQMLSVHRMQQYSNVKGIINVWYDKNDNKRVNINPVEEMKLKYDEARISAIAVLDKIIEGSKNINMNMSFDVKDIKDIFDSVNIKEGNYKTLD